MALICRDILRDLFRFSDHHYEYGLWMPADEYRDDTPGRRDSRTSSSSESISSTSSEIVPEVVVPQTKFRVTWKQVAGDRPSVTASQAGTIARLLGMAPSHSDIEELKANKGDSINSAEVEKWLPTVSHPEDTSHTEDLVNFFAQFDVTHSGVLSVQQIRNILKTYGEPLSDSEVNEALRQFTDGSSTINYRRLVAALLD